MRVALIVGHSAKDKGAVNKSTGIQEFDYNNDLVGHISNSLMKLHVDHDIIYRDSYSGLPGKVNSTNADFALEFHCNAFNEKATGTEMLYWHSSLKGKWLAELCQEAAVKCLSLPDRGVKALNGSSRGGTLLRKTSMPTIIVESFFIDNDDDLSVGKSEIKRLAEAYVCAIYDYIKGVKK